MRKRARTGRTPPLYVIFEPIYTNSCFLDQAVVDAHRAGVLKASFENDEGETMVVHIGTEQFFALHNLNPQDMELWEDMNLQGFFELPPWGPNYMQAYQAPITLSATNNCTIIDLHGAQRQFHFTPELIRNALNLPFRKSLDFNKVKHTDAKNAICSDEFRRTWDDLHRQRVRLAL